MPTLEELSSIEGVVLVDNQPAGGLGGTPSGFGCVVGEFQDMTFGVRIDNTGKVTSHTDPQFALSASDFFDKFGGFDPTIGRFGSSMGNGYIAVTGKVFGTARLLCAPVNLCSDYAGRLWRQLPTNKSATDPNPIVPLTPALVPAGYEFKLAGNRVRTGMRAVFTGDAFYSNGVDGSVTAAGAPAATQTFNAASGDFQGANIPSRKVYEGDMLVVGVLNALGGLGLNAATYRVVSVTSGTALVVQLLDGANFDWTTIGSLPWRLHPGATADTGCRSAASSEEGHQLNEAAGYSIAARPMDATIVAATTMSPTVAPPTPSGTVWDALSGLKFRTHPTQPLTYTAAVQAANAATSSAIEALYQSTLNDLLGDTYPRSSIGAVVCARKSANIAIATLQHCLASFAGGHPRVCFISPPVNTLTVSDVIALSYPGVEPLRSSRCEYHWPAVLTRPIQAAIGTSIATSDGSTTLTGQLDVPMDEYRLALYTRLPPEESPAEAIEPIPSTFATIAAYARGITAPDLATFTLMKARGISGVKIDTPPAQIQSAVNTLLPTSALDPKVPANRQVFADFIGRELIAIAGPYKSTLATQARVDSLVSAMLDFLNSLGPVGSGITPQRIKAFKVTKFSTPSEEDLGVFKFKVDVKMLSTMDFIVISLTAGTTVQITQEA